MKINLAFNESHNGRFVVLSIAEDEAAAALVGDSSVFLFEDETIFLGNVVAADLRQQEMIDVVTTALLSINRPVFPQRWVKIDVSETQIAALGFSGRDRKDIRAPAGSDGRSPQRPAWNFETAQHFHDFLMQAPSPFVMLEGPEHRLTFINPPYVNLIGRDQNQQLVGLTIRECLPELEGQQFFRLLDDVYRTGVPFVGQEVLGRLRDQKTGGMKDRYFDFVYHPTLDADKKVFGIFVQAFDVTDRVLARQVSESREERLYQQWAELDTLYRTAPVGMCLVDAKEYRILRINSRAASLTGEEAEALIGKKLLEVFPGAPGVEEPLRRAAGGDYVRNHEVSTSVTAMPGVLRHWLVSYGPLFGPGGAVEAIGLVSLEVTDRIMMDEERRREGESKESFVEAGGDHP